MTIAKSFSTVEAEVLLVWQDLLDMTCIDPDDDFFAAGGKTRQVDPMLAELARRLQCPAPKAKRFLEDPSRSRLVSLLMESAHASAPKEAPAVRLIRGSRRNSGPAMVYIAPPEATGYEHVADLLPSGGAVYAVLQGGRIEESEHGYACAMQALVDAIRADVPAGKPYVLSGYGLGGTLAYMAAERLQHHGCCGVILLDSPSPEAPRWRLQRTLVWNALRLGRLARRQTALHQEQPSFYTMPRLALPMLLLKAGEGRTVTSQTTVDGWSALLRGPLTTQVVVCEPEAMLSPTHIPQLADLIQQWVRTAGLNPEQVAAARPSTQFHPVAIPQHS